MWGLSEGETSKRPPVCGILILYETDQKSTIGLRERAIERIFRSNKLFDAGDKPKLWQLLKYHVFER